MANESGTRTGSLHCLSRMKFDKFNGLTDSDGCKQRSHSAEGDFRDVDRVVHKSGERADQQCCTVESISFSEGEEEDNVDLVSFRRKNAS